MKTFIVLRFSLFTCFSIFNFIVEEKHLHAGHQILVLNNSIMGHELIIFSVLGLAYIRSMM